MPARQKNFLLRSSLLILLVVALYGGALSHGFVWDDLYVIVENPLLEKLGNIPRMFLAEDSIVGSTGYYRPVTYLSFALDRALWGGDPAGFHGTNLLLHLVAVLLLQRVVAELFRREELAFVAALLFALHPLANETVNFLAGGRNTLLCASFSLLSLLCYLRNRRFLALCSFTVAIYSKEFALLLPLLFFWHDRRTPSEKIRPGRYLPFLLSAGVYLLLRSSVLPRANFLGKVNLSDSTAAPYLVVRYLLNMISPWRLQVMYDIHPDVLSAILCTLVIISLAAVVRIHRREEALLPAACCFLLFLTPVVNIIPLESASLMADRYAYFSLMGFSVLLATLLLKLGGRGVILAVALLCLFYAAIDLERNGIWKNEVSLYSRMTLDVPAKFDGFQNLGMYYYRKGELPRALENLATALDKPEVPAGFLIGSGSVFWRAGMLDKGEEALLRAVRLEPGNPEPYLMLITLYQRNGNAEQARFWRERSEALFHDTEGMMKKKVVQLCNEGRGYLAKGLLTPAENVFWQALQIDPAYAPALSALEGVVAGQATVHGPGAMR